MMSEDEVDEKFREMIDRLDKTDQRYEILLKKLDKIIDDLGE